MPIERFEAIAYPRAAVGNDPPLEQVTTRPAAEFHEYVLTYSRAQRANVGLIFLGAAVAIGAAFYLSDGWLIAGAALGLGLAGGGGAGFLIAAGAHAAYTRYLSVNVTRTYAEPPAPAEAVRPFVPSSNGPATIRAGRFSLPAATWAALLAAADANGGKLTRDAAAKVLPRDLYRDWATTAGELARLGVIDAGGMVTAAGRGMMSGNSPYPIGHNAPTGASSTRARRTHGAHGTESES
ncbi:MAG: hypothetical protein KBG73_00480 [Candidatus Promineofilum sp.]|jgi:hypothetical protein|nr:hypothetical protein [Promineifilum sp.]